MESIYARLLGDPGFIKSLGINNIQEIDTDDGVDNAAFLKRFQQNVAAMVSISMEKPSK